MKHLWPLFVFLKCFFHSTAVAVLEERPEAFGVIMPVIAPELIPGEETALHDFAHLSTTATEPLDVKRTEMDLDAKLSQSIYELSQLDVDYQLNMQLNKGLSDLATLQAKNEAREMLTEDLHFSALVHNNALYTLDNNGGRSRAMVENAKTRYQVPVFLQIKEAVAQENFIKGMGPYDSGTNYFHELLAVNNISDHNTGYWDADDPECWKHTPMQWESHACQKQNKFNIFIARHPLSWFISVLQHPYQLKCSQLHTKSKQHYVLTDKSCQFYITRESPLSVEGNEKLANSLGSKDYVDVGSVADLWNFYYKGYLDTDEPSMIIRYEDLVAEPETVVRKVASVTGVELKKFVPFQKASKRGVPGRVGAEAYSYNIKKEFLKLYSKELMDELYKQLDHDLLEKLSYTF